MSPANRRQGDFMRHYSKMLILAALSIVIPAAAQTPPPAKKAAPSAKAPAAGKASPKATPFDPALLHPETLRAKAPETYDVKFVTTAGDFTVKVTRAWAPNGADRFYNLVRHHFYDGAAFYRAISGFMAQWGISGVPEVDRVWENATIKDDPVRQSNTRGKITYAQTSQPNSRSTQLFINYIDNSRLDKD